MYFVLFCSFLWNSMYICIGCLFTKSLRTTYLLTLKCVWLTFKWMTDWQCLLLPFLRIIFAIFTPHICHFYAFYLPFLRLIFAIFTHHICRFYALYLAFCASYLPFLRIIFAIFMHHIWHFYASYLPFLRIIFGEFQIAAFQNTFWVLIIQKYAIALCWHCDEKERFK
jgi:hypothetical protein